MVLTVKAMGDFVMSSVLFFLLNARPVDFIEVFEELQKLSEP